VRGNQARAKNADLHHSSFTVVMQKRKKKRKFASPVLNVLTFSLRKYNALIKDTELQDRLVEAGGGKQPIYK
jgi:hypothetical protein